MLDDEIVVGAADETVAEDRLANPLEMFFSIK